MNTPGGESGPAVILQGMSAQSMFYLDLNFRDTAGRLVKFGLTHLFDMRVPFWVHGDFVSVFYGKFLDPCTVWDRDLGKSLVIPAAACGPAFDDFLRLNLRGSRSRRGIIVSARNIIRANLGEDLRESRRLLDEFKTRLGLETALRGIGDDV